MNKLKEINGKFYQECEVVMLDTKEAICLAPIMQEDNKLYPVREFGNRNLYFLSNEEIKKNFTGYAIVTVKDDPRIHYLVDVICTEKNQCYCKEDRKFSYEFYSVKPVIATTDLSLNINNYSDVDRLIDFEYNLPQPSQSFIQAFIKAYNEGKPITKVLVECWAHTEEDIQLKVNLSNEVTIKKVKNSYTREEVITFTTILRQFINEKQRSVYEVDKFIEENL